MVEHLVSMWEELGWIFCTAEKGRGGKSARHEESLPLGVLRQEDDLSSKFEASLGKMAKILCNCVTTKKQKGNK